MKARDADLLFEVTEKYWLDFSKLVGETLSKVAPDLRDELLMRIQEKSSYYGSCYMRFVK